MFSSLPTVSNRTIPSQLLPHMAPGQRSKKHKDFHQSGIKSTELLAWRSPTDRERDFCKEKEEKFKPWSKQMFFVPVSQVYLFQAALNQ